MLDHLVTIKLVSRFVRSNDNNMAHLGSNPETIIFIIHLIPLLIKLDLQYKTKKINSISAMSE